MRYHKMWWYSIEERKKKENKKIQIRLAHSTKNIFIRPNIHQLTAELNHHKNISLIIP